ncbi:MAG: hypothetical protein ACKV22_02465, partial [Bryobacteraceae bacterium]
MWAARGMLAATFLVGLASGQQVTVQPAYSAESIVNSADFRQGFLAPNTIATIFGTNLSWSTLAISAADTGGGYLPDMLAGVRVSVGTIRAHLIYVSPTQINFVIPYILIPGPVEIRVDRDGVAGPKVKVDLAATAPAAYRVDEKTIIATRVDGSLLTPDQPARPGEVIVLYVTGLGWTDPAQKPGQLAIRAAQSLCAGKLRVELNGVAIPADRVYYAGVTPGYSGLYQINVALPEQLAQNPEIRLVVEDRVSAAGLYLPATSGPS